MLPLKIVKPSQARVVEGGGKRGKEKVQARNEYVRKIHNHFFPHFLFHRNATMFTVFNRYSKFNFEYYLPNVIRFVVAHPRLLSASFYDIGRLVSHCWYRGVLCANLSTQPISI